MVEADPGVEITLDLESLTVSAGGTRVSFTMPDSDRKSLVSGTWDTTAMLLANRDSIRATAARIPYIQFAPVHGGPRG